jgi:hypothetical protein
LLRLCDRTETVARHAEFPGIRFRLPSFRGGCSTIRAAQSGHYDRGQSGNVIETGE